MMTAAARLGTLALGLMLVLHVSLALVILACSDDCEVFVDRCILMPWVTVLEMYTGTCIYTL